MTEIVKAETREAATKAESDAQLAITPDVKPEPQPQPEPEPDTRTPEQIEADIAATRDRLVGTIGQISDRMAPKNIARRSAAKARAQLVNEEGVRTDRAAGLAGVVAAVVGLLVLRVRRRRGGDE